MEGPELHDGYTRVSNELLEAVCKARLNGAQVRILLLVMRYSYGYQRKYAKLTLKQVQTACSLSKTHAHREIKSLLKAHILTTKNGLLGVQKRYSKWTEMEFFMPKNDSEEHISTVPDTGQLGTVSGTKSPVYGTDPPLGCLPHKAKVTPTKKDTKKDTKKTPLTPQGELGGDIICNKTSELSSENECDNSDLAPLTNRLREVAGLVLEPKLTRRLKDFLSARAADVPPGWPAGRWRQAVGNELTRVLRKVGEEARNGKIGSIVGVSIARMESSLAFLAGDTEKTQEVPGCDS